MIRSSLRLARALGKIAAQGFLGSAVLLTLFHCAMYFGRGEKLTSGEEKIVRTFFSEDEDIPSVRKHFIEKGKGFRGTAMEILGGDALALTAPGCNIVFFNEVAANDYSSKYAQGKKCAVFMHEMTHALTQNGLLPNLKNRKKYEYTLSDSSCYADFGDEQRAAMVGDYMLRFAFDRAYRAEFQVPAIDLKTGVPQRKEWLTADSLLARVVEVEYPGAKILRREAEQRRLASSR